MYCNIGNDNEGALITNSGEARCGSLLFPTKNDSKEVQGFNGVGYSQWQAYDDGWQFEFGNAPNICIAWKLDDARAAITAIMKHADAHGLKVGFADRFPIHKQDCAIAPHRAFTVGCNATISVERDGEDAPTFPNYLEFLHEHGILCGTHMHIANNWVSNHWYEGSEEDRKRILDLVKAVVVYAILPMSVFTNDKDCGLRYRTLGIGNFRIKMYGIEFKDMGSSVMQTPMWYAALHAMIRDVIDHWTFFGKNQPGKMIVSDEIWNETVKMMKSDDPDDRRNFMHSHCLGVIKAIIESRLIVQTLMSPFETDELLELFTRFSQNLGDLRHEWHVEYKIPSHVMGVVSELNRKLGAERGLEYHRRMPNDGVIE